MLALSDVIYLHVYELLYLIQMIVSCSLIILWKIWLQIQAFKDGDKRCALEMGHFLRLLEIHKYQCS